MWRQNVVAVIFSNFIVYIFHILAKIVENWTADSVFCWSSMLDLKMWNGVLQTKRKILPGAPCMHPSCIEGLELHYYEYFIGIKYITILLFWFCYLYQLIVENIIEFWQQLFLFPITVFYMKYLQLVEITKWNDIDFYVYFSYSLIEENYICNIKISSISWNKWNNVNFQYFFIFTTVLNTA